MAGPASASYDPIASGTAKLVLDKGFVSLLKRSDIKLLGRHGVRVKGPVVTLAAAGGKADPTIEKAEIELGGELILATATKRVPFTDITLKTKRTPVFAKVGGGQLKVVTAAKVALERDGFGDELLATKLRLTAKAAQRFDKRLHTDAFAEGQRLGTLRSEVQPGTVAVLPSGSAAIALDPAMLAKLKALSTSLNPIFPAELVAGPALGLPIAIEGAIAPDAASGTLRTAGGSELLRLGAGQIFWSEPWLDLATHTISAELDAEPIPAFPGKLGRTPILDLGLSAAAIGSDPAARTITVSGAPVTLLAPTAALFNQAFAEGKDEFHAGERLGVLSFTAQGQ